MALEPTLRKLCRRAEEFRQALQGLHRTAVDDRPAGLDVSLVGRWENVVEDLVGVMHAACAHARTAHGAVVQSNGMQGAALALLAFHKAWNTVSRRLVLRADAFEPTARLVNMGREHGGECRAWTTAVRQSVRSCRRPLARVDRAVWSCWQELAERLTSGSVAAVAMATAPTFCKREATTLSGEALRRPDARDASTTVHESSS